MKKFFKDFSKEDGYSFMQFALVLPVLMTMLALVFDMGNAVSGKTNVQNLAGEIQKAVILYEEEGVKGGFKEFAGFSSAQEVIDHVIDKNTSVDKEKLDYNVTISEKVPKHFTGHHYNLDTGSFQDGGNRNDIKYVTVTVSYTIDYKMLLTRKLLGDSITVREQFTSLMYAGSDGYDEDKRW